MPIEGKVKKKGDMRASGFIHYNFILIAVTIFTVDFWWFAPYFTQGGALSWTHTVHNSLSAACYVFPLSGLSGRHVVM